MTGRFENSNPKVWWGLGSFFIVAGVLAAAAKPYIQRYHLSAGTVAAIYGCFLVLLILALVPALGSKRITAIRWFFLPALWCLPYLIYAVGTGDWRWIALARLLGVGVPLASIYKLAPVRNPTQFSWQDLFVAVWLIATLLGHQLAGIWNVPVNLDFMGRLFLVMIASWSWVFLRPVPGLGYEFKFSWAIGRVGTVNFLGFAIIAIPLGLALHFIEWNPSYKGVADFCLAFLEIFLFIALLEELFFRGFLQTLIAGSLGSMRIAQVIVSCLFGLFHILHAPFPNWRYVLLATVAGWFYGSAFVKSGSVVASALTHAAVDTVWRTFFSRS
jgi:hypothetical protein